MEVVLKRHFSLIMQVTHGNMIGFGLLGFASFLGMRALLLLVCIVLGCLFVALSCGAVGRCFQTIYINDMIPKLLWCMD